ncbi:hypothetical protein PG994_004135 [Apiospora phragmitis]|uniref:SNF2 N-terminal domain-containing protein n=1 Tax=Apiospora phragmitis TaxID=2905665 RepID=A0ABR1VSF2_9PEZI
MVLDDVSRGEGIDPKLDGDKHWARVCQFFTKEGAGPNQFRLPDLEYAIEGYQAAAVLWLLTRIPDDNVAGALLSDDMGLGKTFTIVITIMVHAYLQRAMRDMKRFWDHPHSEPRHNPAGAAPGRACPSQANNKYYLQCPCVVGSAARAIVDRMGDLPSIIISHSGGATLWVAEWDKFVLPRSGMRLYVGVSGYTGDHAKLADFCEDVEGAQGDADKARIEHQTVVGPRRRNGPRVNKVLVQRRHAFSGGNSHALLLTSEGCGNKQKAHDREKYEGVPFVAMPGRPRRMDYDEEAGVPVAVCGILAMDEMHKYKGANNETQPFQMLNLFKYQDTPTLAIGVSGNLLGIGPEAWQRHVTHTQEWIRRDGLEAKLGRIQTPEGFTQMRKDWDFIQSRIKDIEDGLVKRDAKNEQFDRCKGRIADDFRQGIHKMIIRRTKKDFFLGENILDIAEPVTTPMPLKIGEGEALDTLSIYFRRIAQWMNHVHKEDLKQWERAGKTYARPILAKVQREVLGGGPDGNNSRDGAHHRAFNLALRAVTLPSLAYLPNSEDPEIRRLEDYYAGGQNLNGLDSPKFQALTDLVKTQLIDTRQDNGRVTRQTKGPVDKSQVRHMVVFTEAPVNAYLTALYLQDWFIDKCDVILIHQGLKTQGTEWNCRDEAFKWFDRDCKPEDHNKILLGTY